MLVDYQEVAKVKNLDFYDKKEHLLMAVYGSERRAGAALPRQSSPQNAFPGTTNAQ